MEEVEEAPKKKKSKKEDSDKEEEVPKKKKSKKQESDAEMEEEPKKKKKKSKKEIAESKLILEPQVFDQLSSDEELRSKVLSEKKEAKPSNPETFENDVFKVTEVSSSDGCINLQMKAFEYEKVPVNFKLELRGNWSKTPIEKDDLIRVIG